MAAALNRKTRMTLAQIDEVDGLLVGGASLKAESFLPIVAAFTNK